MILQRHTNPSKVRSPFSARGINHKSLVAYGRDDERTIRRLSSRGLYLTHEPRPATTFVARLVAVLLITHELDAAFEKETHRQRRAVSLMS